MRNSFWGKFRRILVFGLWSLEVFHLQAYTVEGIQTFAQQCLASEDPTDQVKEVVLQTFLISRINTAIYFVKTAKNNEFVIKVIDLKEFSPDHLDDFRGSQLIHRCLQGKALPPNLQFALARFCQVVDDSEIYSIEDEFSPPPEGQLMVWAPKGPGDPISNLWRESAGENLEECLRSIAQADTFLYQNKIGLRIDKLNNRVDFESGMVTIVNMAGVKIDPPGRFYSSYIFGGHFLLYQFVVWPDIIVSAIDLYEDPVLKQHVKQVVISALVDNLCSAIMFKDCELGQIPALIDRYREMGLIPDRIGMNAPECLGPILTKEEFVKILLTNLPDKNKTALQTMYEQQIPKAGVQRGNADPQICDAFQHYLSRVYGVRDAENWFENPDNDYDMPIGAVIQYDQFDHFQKALVFYYNHVHPARSMSNSVNDWKLVFK
ncbi:MAG: hypothetical protein LBJ78_01860 [Puniceicoccales bacterium]|nr:hypothetical protein [Puniceicoccales bacterium]